MALITDKPEDLPTTDAIAGLEDPDEQPRGERAEIYLSGAHVCTLDDAPAGLERITLMVDIEVTEESKRFNDGGDVIIPIRRCRRVGDMYLPGTQRPPSKEEIAAMQAAAKAKAAAEQAERDEAERAEQAQNEPPMFDEEGDPIVMETPQPSDAGGDVVDGEVDGDAPWPGDVENVVQFSDSQPK